MNFEKADQKLHLILWSISELITIFFRAILLNISIMLFNVSQILNLKNQNVF